MACRLCQLRRCAPLRVGQAGAARRRRQQRPQCTRVAPAAGRRTEHMAQWHGGMGGWVVRMVRVSWGPAASGQGRGQQCRTPDSSPPPPCHGLTPPHSRINTMKGRARTQISNMTTAACRHVCGLQSGLPRRPTLTHPAAATCSGVLPFASGAAASAPPCCSSSSTRAVALAAAAMCSGDTACRAGRRGGREGGCGDCGCGVLT